MCVDVNKAAFSDFLLLRTPYKETFSMQWSLNNQAEHYLPMCICYWQADEALWSFGAYFWIVPKHYL